MNTSTFVERPSLLRQLRAHLEGVQRSGQGRMLVVRGRRQVGKSRLLTEFCTRSEVPILYWTARRNASTYQQLAALASAALDSGTPLSAADALASSPSNWGAAFRQLRVAIGGTASVVVFDEFPWAAHADPVLESELQIAWDQSLEGTPLLLVLVGSDVTMMERLTAHDRPLYGRGRELVVRPFDPAEVQEALGTGPVATFDATLVTGGYPRLVAGWAGANGDVHRYVGEQLADDNSDLAVLGQRSLDAEFPPTLQARLVLGAIGAEQRSFSAVSNALGGQVSSGPLTRSLRVLCEDKSVVAEDRPLGPDSNSRLRRYRVADPYLRFWLRFVEPALEDIARGRGDLAVAAFEVGWLAWRDRAIEPLIREAVLRLARTEAALANVTAVGGWWDRQGREVDVVAVDRRRAVVALGSIKWRDKQRFDRRDAAELAAARGLVPDAGGAKLIALTAQPPNSGLEVDIAYDAATLLTAWA